MPAQQSDFVMRIVHRPSQEIVEWAPGMAVEFELVEGLCNRVRAKGVGIGRTESHVIDDVRDAFLEMLKDLKKLV